MASGIKMCVPYFQSPNDVFEIGLNKHELLVYLYLCRCGNHGGKAFPSYNTMAEKCNISRRTAIYAVNSLVERGLLHKEKRSDSGGKENYSNIYTVETNVRGNEIPAPPGEITTPPSAGHSPYKEPDNKKQVIKSLEGVLQGQNSWRPLDDFKTVLDHYFDIYGRYTGKEHPILSTECLERIATNLFNVYDQEYNRWFEIDVETLLAMIDRHFDTKYEHTNWNIMHFLSDNIKAHRYFESC